jgi:signal transduction histidine kinase
VNLALRLPSRVAATYGLVLGLAFAVVMACFAGSTYYADLRMREITRSSREISQNALPSIVHLALLRTRLRDVERVTTEATEGRGLERRALDEALRAISSEEASYLALPEHPTEARMWGLAHAALEHVRTSAAQVADDVARGEMVAARGLMESDVRPSLADADEKVRAVIDLNADAGSAAADDVEAARLRATRIAYVLDAASVLVSTLLAIVTFLVIRGYARVVERRAEELEQFASRVAHDVRGPLGPAVMALDWLARDMSQSDPKLRAVTRGRRSLDVVSSLVDGLFAFASSGARPQAGAKADLRDAIDAVMTEAAPFAQTRNVDLEAEDLPDAKVACAPGVLASVLSNLVRNGIKYVDGGETRRVTVRGALKSHRVHVEVADTGPGLPEGAEERVFQPYVRVQKGGHGLGLGLATVKRLVDAHGGNVGVRSRPGEGAVFWFELPTVSRT